jgi:hypothetical protein
MANASTSLEEGQLLVLAHEELTVAEQALVQEELAARRAYMYMV